MLTDALGPAQIAAVLVLAQRGLEELYSRRNTGRLLRAGAYEVGRGYYPVVATAHLAWIASLLLLIPVDAPVYAPLIAAFVALQLVRYWIIATLGRFWTHRIITLDGAPIERRGPYRFVRHPNYALTIAETFLLPAAFSAWALAIIMTAIWTAVISYKITLEDGALSARKTSG
jgi:methyltransferase